ncbi:MAG: LptE family protein [Coprobacter sp.]|nr:LptE family protein [Coprobacter sp.]
MKRIFALILITLASCTISYKFNGASIDYTKTKTITIADFPIRATLVYPPLGPAFNEALKDIYTRQTRLTLVNSGGDLLVEGEITGYNLSPQAVTEDAYASQTRLTVTVKVRYTNTKDPQFDLDQSFSAYRDFSSNQMLNQVQDELIKEIVEELANLIFNATVANW